MGRMKFLAVTGALTLSLLSVPAAAQNKGLNCMRGQYTPAETARIEALGPTLTTNAQLNDSAMNTLGEIAMAAIQTCAERYDWGDREIAFATLYELGRVAEVAYRAGDDLTPRQFELIDEALASGNRDILWSIIEGSVLGGIDGQPDPVTQNEAILLGLFVSEAGLLSPNATNAESEQMGEKVGVLLGFMGLQRISLRMFDSED